VLGVEDPVLADVQATSIVKTMNLPETLGKNFYVQLRVDVDNFQDGWDFGFRYSEGQFNHGM
jgi:hypothetical protein